MRIIDSFAKYQAAFYEKTSLETKIHTAASAALIPLVFYLFERSFNLYFWYSGSEVVPFKNGFNYETWLVLHLVYSTIAGYMVSQGARRDRDYRIIRHIEYLSRIY